jgi:RimJ/RimL family protein N-acetyltransferase
MSALESAPQAASLETERLILRLPRLTDAVAVVELANNTRIAENLATLPYPYSLSDAEDWVGTSKITPKSANFGVFLKHPTPVFVGAAGFRHRTGGSTEIGYWIGQPHWERGYATEAARAIVDFVFQMTDLSGLRASCRVTNEASRRVIIRCGFQYEVSGTAASRFLAAWFRWIASAWISRSGRA